MRCPQLVAALILALSTGFAGCSTGDGPSDRNPPNLLLVTIDTLRADRLACYGGPGDVGLEICAVADGGTLFEWAFSTAPATAPSIASLLTSLYPAQHGVEQSSQTVLSPDLVTVTELLEEAGYTTAAFVSNPVLDRSRNLGQGFKVYDQRMTRRERNRPGFAEREAASTTDAALAWAEVALKSPWFLWVHYQDPHGPYEPPGAPAESNDKEGNALSQLADDSGIGGIPNYQALPGLTTAGPYERRYLDEIRYLGPHLERLVSGLDALGRRPALILTSDHGEAFGEDGVYFAHGHSVALDQIRVPLLFRPADAVVSTSDAAGRGSARVERDPASTLDIAPTLLGLAGIEVPDQFEGRPLPVARRDGARPEERAIYSEGPLYAAVIAGGRYFTRAHRKLPPEGTRPTGWPTILRLPPRTAQIPFEGTAPRYSEVVGAALSSDRDAPDRALIELLDSYLARERGTAATGGEVSETLRRRLRALGYAE